MYRSIWMDYPVLDKINSSKNLQKRPHQFPAVRVREGRFYKFLDELILSSTFLKKRTLSIINQTDSSFRRCSVTFEKSNSRSTLYFCVYLNYNLVSSIFRYLGGEGNWLGLGAPSRDPQGVGRLFWNPLCGNRWLIVPFFFFHLSCWERPIKIQSLFFWWSTSLLCIWTY